MGAAPSGFVREPRMGAGRGGEHGSGLPANECGERASGRISYAGGSQLPLLGTGLHVSAIDAAVQVAVPVRLIALGVVGLLVKAGAVATDTQVRVKRLKLLKGAEVKHLDGPRWTGDGYYESTFLDPEGNRLELTI